MIKRSICETVGNTPVVKLEGLIKKLALRAEIYLKIESFNPFSSAKDRVALKMIEEGEKSGIIVKGTTLIEPTSGNTGIGICAVAASKGYSVIMVMPENMSIERQKLMKAYGARLVLTNKQEGMTGAIKMAEELKREIGNAVILGQFDNPANPLAHYETTAPEIYEDFGDGLDFFVAGIGTGGAVSGVGKYFKEKGAKTKIIGVEPFNSPVITKGISGVHKIQGIGAGFIPKNLDISVVDGVITATDDNAMFFAREVAKTDGILIGISGGASLSCAVEIAKKEENFGKKILVFCVDSGERYLSTELFE